MTKLPFEPNFLLRNKHVQTILSSKKKPNFGKMVASESLINLHVNIPISINSSEMVNLNGYYSSHKAISPKGLVILLHGWLGSSTSSYMLANGERLYQQGFAVMRLNMRDHGNTLHLNQGIFHGCRLEEIYQAIKQIAAMNPELPVTLLGFSMGGSFALRVAWRNSIGFDPIDNFKKVIAICPSVDPEKVTNAIDNSKIYRRYFCNKWKKNLAEKQRCFPDLYNFDEIISLKNCKDITDALIEKYSNYAACEDYFSEYQLTKEKLESINIPVEILAAKDDPVIPIDSFDELKHINPKCNIYITEYGGHVGYIDSLSKNNSWLDKVLPSLMAVKE